MRRRAASFLIVALLSGLSSSAAAQAVPKDEVHVAVRRNGQPVEGVRVKTVGEPPGGGEIAFGEAVTGPDGVAVFQVPFRPGLVVRAAADYQGVVYQSGQVQLAGDGATGVALAVDVFERLKDDLSSLSFGPSSHLLVELEQGGVQVTEFLFVKNASRRTVAPEGGLVFELPGGFRDVTGAGGNPVATVPHVGARVPGPFLPGDTEVRIRFHLPVTGRELSFEQPLPLPMATTRVIVDESPELRVEGPAVRGQETRQSEGMPFRVAGLDTSDGRIRFELKGLPHQSSSGRWVALAVSLGILAGGGVLAVGRRRERARLDASRQAAEAERDDLLADLEQLERDRRAGRIDAEAYDEDRREILGRLANALRILESP